MSTGCRARTVRRFPVESSAATVYCPLRRRVGEGAWVRRYNGPAAAALGNHSVADVRRWTLRLVGDRPREFGPDFAQALVALARTESDPRVLAQFAASARRFDADTSLAVTLALLGRTDAADDPHIPLLLWWALEKHTESQRDRVVAAFRKASLWDSPIVREHILARLARRYAQSPTPMNQRTLAALLRQAPDGPTRDRLVDGVREALRGRGARGLAESLIAALDETSADSRTDPTRVELRLRSGDRGALVPAIGLITTEPEAGDTSGAIEARRMRVRLIEAVSELGLQETSPVLLDLVGRSTDEAVRSACLAALGRLDAPDLPRGIFATWTRLGGGLRHQALGVLVSRRAWARSLIQAVGASGAISKSEIPDDIVDRLRLFGDDDMTALVVRTFGREKRATTKEKAARITELAATISSGPPGDPTAGRAHYQKLCGTCHKLFAEGGKVGPDLTVQERSNLDNMLLQIVDPSAGIREGYTQFVVVTTGGRTLTGVIVTREGDRIELLDPTGRRIVLPTEQIVVETAQSTSLMPEGLLDGLDENSIRDFFAYFMSSPGGAPNDSEKP